MDSKYLFLLLSLFFAILFANAQHENIPYEDVEQICEKCLCLTTHDTDQRYHHLLRCTAKRFQHILARWPEEFGSNHNGVEIIANFSNNTIELLQQLPATNATLTFTCRHCGIKYLQAPTFVDVPNLSRLDLSWNELIGDALTPDVFRGAYRGTHYEPIALIDLDLSHNKLLALDRKLFEHTTHLRKLNLSYNQLKLLNTPTVMALASAIELEELDLSYNAIKTLSASIFKTLLNLRILNLSGNELISVPDKLKLIGKRLIALNLAGNPIANLTAESFMGLQSLERLNMSYMPELKKIGENVFTRLEALRHLDCSYNPKLAEFDMESLTHSNNLLKLDISHCALTTLTLTIDTNKNSNSTTKPWPHLLSFEIVGNPWFCDCHLLQTLEYINVEHGVAADSTPARCDTPYLLAGARISNLSAAHICSLKIPQKYKAIEAEQRPRFLRKRYIIFTVIAAAVVVAVGVLLGLAIAAIRRRLKRADFGVEPIRYTSVRSSNLSAFSHANANTFEATAPAAALANGNGVRRSISNA